MSELTDEQIRMLAECERKMDSGEMPYVIWRGQRLSQRPYVMERLGLVVGQTISDPIFKRALELGIEECQKAIALRDTEEMMAKITKKREE